MSDFDISGRAARRIPEPTPAPPRGMELPEPVARMHRWVETPLGRMVVAAGPHDGRPAITGCWFEDQKHFPDDETLGMEGDHALLSEAQEQLEDWYAGRRRGFDLPLALDDRPQPLRPRVWKALQEIPFGTTTTYGALAQQLGNPGMAQAVGQGVGRNPWSVIVPCHRVLSSTGVLTGYAGGIERKQELLEMESRRAAR
ncbi:MULTISPECIES: methylated-DNA--[protein]-cysteine S-methyltransferase [Kocuria]|uniref:methylated-DNA--[protein]-cysteine S-methyltransferase n=1 Tax=Kocuria TaxID=57493 RepID=UPI00201E317B|nr:MULTISPECIES: methylated-DNA--[protein]-cysteine S-methyltransferase [Kocuria]MCT1591833.1 methylated-DNA--[protein]-cysteine S-methyltransferase [Kocuria palustris]